MNIFIRLVLFGVVMLFVACKDSRIEQITGILRKWDNKEIHFSSDLYFSTIKGDTIPFSIPNSRYKIMTYVDSTGCMGCKLNIDRWIGFIDEVKSLTSDSIPFLFFFHPKNELELRQLLYIEMFDYPFCIDMEDKMNKLNCFPDKMLLQTFLLDKNNRVVAVGNPIYSDKVKDLYFNIITSKDVNDTKDFTEISTCN